MVEQLTIKEFSKKLASITKSDRWVLGVCTGDMGEGKSCLTSQLLEEYAKEAKIPFTYSDSMTYSRKELKLWIDGDKSGKGQKKERSPVLADELISMFFKRNWYDFEQIDGIELLNKCRDRHLLVFGNVPNFWDLDGALLSLTTFRLHVYERGVAWVFMKDRNPFVCDPWHMTENAKLYRKHKNPYSCIGFVGEIRFRDWSPKDKEEYYTVRNEKRKNTEGQREKLEKYRLIKEQRDTLIRLAFQLKPDITEKDIADTIDLSETAVHYAKTGER